MKAVTYEQPGKPDVLRYQDVPDPSVGDGEVLVQLEAICIEGGDLVSRRLQPGTGILGYAAAGEVLSIGKGVKHIKPGQKVTTFAPNGSHAEMRVVPEVTCWPVPDGLDMKVAAAIPVGPGTAAYALMLAGIEAGQIVMVQGAAGGVGFAAAQLAHRKGARVIGTGRNADILSDLKGYGLDDGIVVDGQTPASSKVRELLGGLGADVLIDCVGGGAFRDGMAALNPGGKALMLGSLAGLEPIDTIQILLNRLTVIGCFFGPVMGEKKERELITSLLEDAATGKLMVPIDKVFSLSDVVAAHTRAETSNKIGRVIMIP